MNPEFPFTRFAPSPTGYLHRGHVLSALFVYAAAKKLGYRVRLRIEDHDLSRTRPAYIDAIREDLEWLGFAWEAESIQSAHPGRYESFLEKLGKDGLVYACDCSRKFTFESNPVNADGEIIYRGHCRERGLAISENRAIRFKTPDETIGWSDLRLGNFRENPREQCGDFALRDRLGQWTYQFAVVADDYVEGVGLVVRGEDLKNSTARQIALFRALGRNARPLFMHHPLLFDPTGKKLSKRERAVSIREERLAGKSAEALLGEVCHSAHFCNIPEPLSVNDSIQLAETYLFPKI